MAWTATLTQSVWFWIALLCVGGAALLIAGNAARVQDDGDLRGITWNEIIAGSEIRGCGRNDVEFGVSRSAAEYAASSQYAGRPAIGSGLACYGEGESVGAPAWAVKVDAWGCFITPPVAGAARIELSTVIVAVDASTGEAGELPFRVDCYYPYFPPNKRYRI